MFCCFTLIAKKYISSVSNTFYSFNCHFSVLHSWKICKLKNFPFFFYRFPFGEEEVLPLALVPNGRKKKKQQSKHKEWPGTKKHKRKMATLTSMAEQDRRLSLLQLPQMPSSSSQYPAEHPSGLECCPTVVEMVQPNGGTNMEGHVVALYRHGDLDQRIYEHSCRPDVLDQPCRFVEKLLRPLSRCVQQYSFTYAVVADQPSGGNNGGSDWRLDYIRIRNGCACQIATP